MACLRISGTRWPMKMMLGSPFAPPWRLSRASLRQTGRTAGRSKLAQESPRASSSSGTAAERATGASPLIGRVEEMGLLRDHWNRTRQGAGGAVLLQGEAGMGKSRIVDALSRDIEDEPHFRVLCQCSPYHMNSSLYPVIRHFERAAGFAPADSASCKLQKLEALLAAGGAKAAATTSLMADLLSIPTDGRYPPLDLPPAQRKGAIVAALVDQLTELAAQKPVLFVLEDAHWIDPTSQELVTRLAEGIATTG